jgi:uncharacterized repeat protein (TIGR01451 family)
MFRITSTAVLLGVLATAPAAAQDGKIELKAVAEVEVVVEKPNGETEIQRQPANKVVPGDDVVYTITATNVSDAPVGDVVIVDPIPTEMTYKSGTAIGTDTEIQFSVDQGKTYDVAANLVVAQSDGAVRPATPDDYTHIRWKFTQEIDPGASSFVRFQATLQ